MSAGEPLTVDRFLAVLGGPPKSIVWNDLYAALQRAHADGDLPWLTELADRLGPSAGAHPFSHVFDIAVRAVAIVPGAAAVDTLVALTRHARTLGARPHALPDAATRALASYLAHAQTDATLAAAIDGHAGNAAFREVLATWAQERVTRGADLRGLAPVVQLFRALAAEGHALAALPLHPLPLEERVPLLASYHNVLGGSRWARPPLDASVDPSAGQPLPGFARVEDAELVERAEAAFATSKLVSNGRSETAFFLLERPITPDDLAPARLQALPLACVADAPPPGLRGQQVTPEHAFAALSWAAANGGDYNIGESGAFGRREAWRSIAALVGARDGDLAGIEEAARASAFWHVEPETPWFDRIMTDLCLAVLRPAGDVLAVTAWTDSD